MKYFPALSDSVEKRPSNRQMLHHMTGAVDHTPHMTFKITRETIQLTVELHFQSMFSKMSPHGQE